MRSLAIIALLFGVTAHAQTRVLSVSGAEHTCKELRELVQHQGQLIVRGWLGGEHTFVSSAEYCPPQTEMLSPAYDRSSDRSLCLIGYSCEGDIYAD